MVPLTSGCRNTRFRRKPWEKARRQAGGFARIIEPRIRHPAVVQFTHALLRSETQFLDLAELDGFSGASLSACRRQTGFLPVITKSALECSSIMLIFWTTPNGPATTQYEQPLQTSGCAKTPPNSVRTIAPVGHASRHPATSQCLQTSEENAHELRSAALPPNPGLGSCSTNFTCRQVEWPTAPVLS